MSITAQEFYHRANLKENPFRSTPIYSSDPRINIWVGYEKQRNQFMKFLARSRADQVGNINFLMLFGHYGAGKSHALNWANNQIMQVQKDDFQSLSYLIPTLRKDKGKMTFAGAFVEDLVSQTTLCNDILEFRHFLGSCVIRHNDVHHLGNVKHDDIIEKLIEPVELYEFAKEIYKCDTIEDVKELIVPKGLTDYQAMTIFTRLVNLFVYPFWINGEALRFKKAVYLMIDELDDLFRVSTKEARDVNDIIRHIYDRCPNCFGFVIALSAESATFSALFEEYILDRIQRRIELDQLGKDEAVEFIRQMLSEFREKNDARTGFFPFEESAIESIVSQIREITPRKVINTMQQVIEEVRLAGLDPSSGLVDLDFLDRNDILDEVLGEGGIG